MQKIVLGRGQSLAQLATAVQGIAGMQPLCIITRARMGLLEI